MSPFFYDLNTAMKRLHVEASTFCNARCPLCPRNVYGYNVTGVYQQEHLSLEKYKECLLQFPDRTSVFFNGNLGDPMMNPDIASLTKASECSTSVTTNGSIGNRATWIALAQQGVSVIFSIDGLEDTNHLYRQDVEWSKIMERVHWFISNGGEARWKWVVFRHNHHQIDQAKQLSKELGFKNFHTEDHGRNYGPASDAQGNITHWILPHDDNRGPDPAWLSGRANIKEKVERYKQDNDNFLNYQNKVYQIECEHELENTVYINAKGEIFPCCYQGFNLPNRGRTELSQFRELKKTWNTKNCDKVCAQNCGH